MRNERDKKIKPGEIVFVDETVDSGDGDLIFVKAPYRVKHRIDADTLTRIMVEDFMPEEVKGKKKGK